MALVCLSALWAFINYMNHTRGQIAAYRQIEAYRPAEFTVERVFYTPKQRRSPANWGAYGQVEGQPEEFNLAGFLQSTPTSQAELERQFPPGTVLPVMYNPNIADTGITGVTIRVMPRGADFRKKRKERLDWWLKFTFAPLVVSLALLTLTFLFKRK